MRLEVDERRHHDWQCSAGIYNLIDREQLSVLRQALTLHERFPDFGIRAGSKMRAFDHSYGWISLAKLFCQLVSSDEILSPKLISGHGGCHGVERPHEKETRVRWSLDSGEREVDLEAVRNHLRK